MRAATKPAFLPAIWRACTCALPSRTVCASSSSRKTRAKPAATKKSCSAFKGGEPYRYFKYESGRASRAARPGNRSAGRIHTSTATVAVLPEVEEDDAESRSSPRTCKIDTFKASGAGGQYVNKTESAIRITHVPSGHHRGVAARTFADCRTAKKRCRCCARCCYERKQREQEEAVGSLRRSQVGTGDRSEKIRTYNFPQDRMTDHRINQSFGNIRGDHGRRSSRRSSTSCRPTNARACWPASPPPPDSTTT